MLVLAALLWGIAYSIQSYSSSALGPYTIGFLKMSCGIPLLIFCIINKRKFNKTTIIGGIALGFIVLLGTFFQQLGIERTSVSKSSFLSVLYIVLVPLFELLFGKKPKNSIWLAILLAIIGIYLLCMSEVFSINIGDIFVFIGSIFWALQILVIDRVSDNADGLVLAGISQSTSCIISFVLMIINEPGSFVGLGSNMIFPILYTIFLSGFLAETIQSKFQRNVQPSLASLLLSLESVFGALGGWLILNQTLSIKEIMGCVLIFIAIIIAE